MHSDRQQSAYSSNEPEYINLDLWEHDDDEENEDEEEKPIPPLYICIHRNDPAHCDLWDQHPRSRPTVYENVTPETPCRFCGHIGTLQKVN